MPRTICLIPKETEADYVQAAKAMESGLIGLLGYWLYEDGQLVMAGPRVL
jgi:hypothetical protein